MLQEWACGWWRVITYIFSINKVMFNFGMLVARKKQAQISTNTRRCTLFGLLFFSWNRMCPQPTPPTRLLPFHPPHIGLCGHIIICPLLCSYLLPRLQPHQQWLLHSLLVETRFFLQETDQSSPLFYEAFLTSLFTLLSTFLCTNCYCSSYHYLVKISVCFLHWTVNLWGRVLVRKKE